MAFFEKRSMRRSRAKALNYGIWGSGQFQGYVAQGFNPAAGVMSIGTRIAKEAGGHRGCHGVFRKTLDAEEQG